MQSEAYLQVIYHFFLDGAKIIFASLVVGLFAPGATHAEFSLFILISGLGFTVIFLWIAQETLSKIYHPLTKT